MGTLDRLDDPESDDEFLGPKDPSTEGEVFEAIEAVKIQTIRILTNPAAPAVPAIDPRWDAFLKKDDVNVGTASFEPKTGAYSLLGSERIWNLPFSSAKNATMFPTSRAVVEEDTILMAVDKDALSKNAKAPVISLGSVIDAVELGGTKVTGLIRQVVGVVLSKEAVTLDPNAGNGIWLIPGDEFQVVTKLYFKLDKKISLDEAIAALAGEFGFKGLGGAGEGIEIHLRHTIYGTPIRDAPGTLDVSAASIVRLKIPLASFVFWVEHSAQGTQVSMTERQTPGDGDLFSRFFALGAGAPSDNSADPKRSWPTVFPKVHLWNAMVLPGSPSPKWQLRLIVPFSPDPSIKNTLLVGLMYDSASKTFTGTLLFKYSFPDVSEKLLPYFDPRYLPPADIAASIQEDFDLALFFGGIDSRPKGIPTTIVQGSISYSPGDKSDNSRFSLSCTLVRKSNQPAFKEEDGPAAIPAPFTWDQLSFSANRTGGNKPSMSLFTSFSLNPRPEDQGKYSPAVLWVNLDYTDGVWDFTAQAENLQFGVLTGYFQKDFRDPLTSVLGKFSIKRLTANYTFESGGAASSFLFSGDLLLGDLEMM